MAAQLTPKFVIFSDLDGTFLDHDSYAFDEALPAYGQCLSRGVRVVFCSSKTQAEMQPLFKVLGTCPPFISENGGAIFIPRAYFPFAVDFQVVVDGYGVIRLGAGYSALTSTLDSISLNLGISIRAFHQMAAAQIAAKTGLPYWKAALIRVREYDGPFVFTNGSTPDVDRFRKTVEILGLRWTRGGRFHHILGHAGKRPAVPILTSFIAGGTLEVSIAALATAPTIRVCSPQSMSAFLCRSRAAVTTRLSRARSPASIRSPLPGPRGWARVRRTSARGTGRIFRAIPPGRLPRTIKEAKLVWLKPLQFAKCPVGASISPWTIF